MQNIDTYVLNFFFGKIIEKPIEFEYTFPNLKDNNGSIAHIHFSLFNDKDLFPNEKQFAEFNSLSQKQKIGHNFHAVVRTGHLRITYPHFNSEDSYTYTETINCFLSYFISYLLTFFQRRRVIFGCPKFTSGNTYVLAMPPFLSGELVDSVSYGKPLISYENTQSCLLNAITTYKSLSDINKINMLLLRYNETLNLPYTYERVESFWRILESLSQINNLSNSIQSEYERLKIYIGLKKNSNILKKFIKTLLDFNLYYNDDDVKNCFIYRNKIIHEYLSNEIINYSDLPDIFRFLNICIEKIILSFLKIDQKYYNKPSYSIIQNRIL